MNHAYLTKKDIEEALESKQITKTEAKELKKILENTHNKKLIKSGKIIIHEIV